MKITITALAALVLLSCTKSRPANTTDITGDIWPIKVNNQWTYADTIFSFNGTVNYSTGLQKVVLDDTAVLKNGKQFYHVKNFYNGNPLLCEGDKVYRLYGSSVQLFLAVPSRDNEILFTDDDGTYKNETVGFTTKYKIEGYECWKNERRFYVAGELKGVDEYYFSESVGVVRLIARYKMNNNSSIFTDLERYSLKSYKLN